MQRHASCLERGTCFVHEEGRTFLLYLQSVCAPLVNQQIVIAEVDASHHDTYVVFLEEKLSLMLWATREDAEHMLSNLLHSFQDSVSANNPVSHILSYGAVNSKGAVVIAPQPNKVLH